MYAVHMTTDTRETSPLPRIIPGAFWFCLLLSVAGNVVATWGHPQDAVIGGLFPVLLVLAERVLHAAGRAPWWVRVLIALVAVACMIWSAVHLASLVHGTWMRWLIPVAVDALLLLTGLLIVSHSSLREAPAVSVREALERMAGEVETVLLPDPGRYGSLPVGDPVPTVREIQKAVDRGEARWEGVQEKIDQKISRFANTDLSGFREALDSERQRREEATVLEETETETETVTRTTTRRVSSSGDLYELVSRMRAGVEAGETKPTISAAKTYLGVGHTKAKDVVALLSSPEHA